MRVVIAGSRGIKDYELLEKAVAESGFEITTVISGNAYYGVDKLGEHWAEEHNIPVEYYPADWSNISHPDAVVLTNKYGKPYDVTAGHRRNEIMAKNADALLTLWDGKSKGTKNMMELAAQYGLSCYCVKVNIEEYKETKRLNLQDQAVEWAKNIRQNKNAVVLDTESCGATATDEIISLGICRLHDGKVLFDSLLRPSKDVHFNWYASKVHGIKEHQLISAPTLSQMWDKIYPLLHNNDVLAYNYSADKRMLFQTARKYNLDIPEVSWHCIMNAFKKFTLRTAATNLTAACAEMKVKAGAHDALDDALAAARIVYRIEKNYGRTNI